MFPAALVCVPFVMTAMNAIISIIFSILKLPVSVANVTTCKKISAKGQEAGNQHLL